jgi:protein tyrosine phosphatase (PTP) superfamily phosphohydrolase (DUF442 family)
MRRRKQTWFQRFLKSWLYLMLIWLFTGFALGTLILLFPLRSWVNYVRDNDMSDTVEKGGVVVMMLLLAIVSFFISYRLYKWHVRKQKTLITILVSILPFFAAIGALALFMNPNLVNSGSESADISQQFTIGPYPTDGKIRELKAAGFTGIISLLHPAVVPFEPSLLNDEEKATKENGVELVKAPMLPWIGDNSASLKKIEDIVKSGKGKYYIHCYLGKDRGNVVRNLITKLTGESSIKSEIGSTHRTFEKMKKFERGDIYKLGEDIYMTPYPTDEEFLSFFLAGRVKSVVNLMDEKNVQNQQWITKEREELKKSTVTFRFYSLKETPSETAINAIVDSVMALPKPVVLHRWNTHSPDTRLIRKIFAGKTGYTPINLFTNALEPD